MPVSADSVLFFRQHLLEWSTQHPRPLPWKGEQDPYLIWLSEIILQQTRVAQGLPYFERFRAAYPTVQQLAAAPEDEVLKHWEGLGYYSRARNMHAAARYIAQELDGRFPGTYADILALKGVGPYTAAAIASFAFDLPHAVLDGNVFRVLARFFGITTPTDSTEGKKQFQELAQQALDHTQAGRYNQAIMDFGATQCTPHAPDCVRCPLQSQCTAYQQNRTDALPVKAKKISKRERFFHFLVLQDAADQTLLRKRTDKDIWQHLYEFPMIELRAPATGVENLQTSALWQQLVGTQTHQLTRVSPAFRQTLTHQVIHACFFEIALPCEFQTEEPGFIVAKRKNLSNFAFPRIVDWYLQDNTLYLNLL